LNTFKKPFAVVNPCSGNGKAGKKWPAVKKILEEYFGEFEFAMTEREGHGEDIARGAISRGHDLIISIGGDGTNNEVLNGFFKDGRIINPEAVFSVIGTGTGGDFVRTLGFPRDAEECVRRVATGSIIHSDIGKITFIDHSGNEKSRYFLNIASFGMSGLADQKVNSTSKFLGARISFLLGSLRAFLEYKNQFVSLRVDNGPEEKMLINNIAVANGCFFGGGMRVAPLAKVDDGLFDIVVMGRLTTVLILKNIKKIYKGTHGQLDEVTMMKGKRVRAESSEEVLIDLDGEQPGKLPATFEVVPLAIPILC